MTIINYDKFALMPTRCNKCNRLFIFEPYDIYCKRYVMNCLTSYRVKCKKCKENEE